MSPEVTDEISLRDVYLIIKKHLRLIVGITASITAVALILSLVLPKTFSSQVVMNLAVNAERPELKAAPNAVGLSQGFIQLVSNESLATTLQEQRLEGTFKAKYDDKKSLLTLSASGDNPDLALSRAERFQIAAVNYFNKQISDTVRTNLKSTLAQLEIDLASSQDNLKRLEPLLNSTKAIANNTQDTAALESRGIDPQLARASNPALVNLALQISQIKVGLAALQAKQNSLESILQNQKAFDSLLGQGFQVQVLAVPAKAIVAEAPRPLMITALAAVAGLLIGLVGAFVLEALRPAAGEYTYKDNNRRIVVPQASPGD